MTTIAIDDQVLIAAQCERCLTKIYPASGIVRHLELHLARDLQVKQYISTLQVFRNPGFLADRTAEYRQRRASHGLKNPDAACHGCGKVKRIYAKHLCDYCYHRDLRGAND
jgi:hypothetical protein